MADITKQISDLASSDQAVANAAMQTLRDEAWRLGAADQAAARKALAGQLAAALNTKQPPQVANVLCDLLSLIGDQAEVATLATVLNDAESREYARAALERIPGKASLDALVAAAKTGDATFRVGVINSLGVRGGDDAIVVLESAAADKDPQVALAAGEALATLGVAAADEQLIKLAAGSEPRAKLRSDKARVRLAEKLAAGGNKDAAKKIFQSVASGDAAPAQKFAAEQGLKKLGWGC
jgi:hypothetical protein